VLEVVDHQQQLAVTEYPGNTVPAKRMADGADHEIVIDWDAALAQSEAVSV